MFAIGEHTLARKLVLVQPKMVRASRSMPTTRLHLPKSRTLLDVRTLRTLGAIILLLPRSSAGGSNCSFAAGGGIADIMVARMTEMRNRQNSEECCRYCPWEEVMEIRRKTVTKRSWLLVEGDAIVNGRCHMRL